MLIRPARIEDSKAIATLMMLAMEDFVHKFIGSSSKKDGRSFLNHFVQQPDNQYSYMNCWVIEVDNAVVGVANVYDGAKMKELREPILNYIAKETNSIFEAIDETEAGEFYIDTIAVDVQQQGKGFGKKLLQFLKQKFVVEQKQTLGLLVDKENPKAKQLYLNQGFAHVGEKHFIGKQMYHLQLHP